MMSYVLRKKLALGLIQVELLGGKVWETLTPV